jgi:xanthosine utilization system XapX-like protein
VTLDEKRLHYTYGGGLLIVVIAFALIFLKIGDIPAEALIALVGSIFGLVLGFFFNRESGAGAARATERAVAQGAAGGASPGDGSSTTVTSSDPSTVSVTSTP